MVAVLYLIMGLFRLGFVLELLSRPIISAFLTAGALIIAFSQVKCPAELHVTRDSCTDISCKLLLL